MSHGREYIELYVQRGLKTRTGADAGNALHAFHPRTFATGTNCRCPVTLFKKKFLEKRTPSACTPDSPLYLCVATSQQTAFGIRNNQLV